MTIQNLENKIFVSITDNFDGTWRNKLQEINELGLTEAALFLEQIRTRKERDEIYTELKKSSIQKIPLVHIRGDMEKDELEYLCQNYNNPCLTIHESDFSDLGKWDGFYPNLYLELNYDNFVSNQVRVEKIGGFCVDLSHFKASEEKWSKDFEYVLKNKNQAKYFTCNHLNGYSYEKKCDKHTVDGLNDFEYLKTLPEFIFGDVIAIETYNAIPEQLKFREYVINLLQD